MTIRPEQGKDGRWRLMAYHGERKRNLGPIRGFSDEQLAYEDAVDLFGQHCYIESNGVIQSAPERRFN